MIHQVLDPVQEIKKIFRTIEGEESLRMNLHSRLVENIAFRKGTLKGIKSRDYLIGLSVFQGDSWSQGRITSQGQVKYANEQI